ncbi:hypothetical protein N7493_000537 [Penicillium malachiteum]|uniref:Uncharacterized protein n=1 Tax=Penicillium malachiteum TaxID=1324776 RepID=A0AAD6N1J0_9EURO|nr:hypothetical protein N7493_000537 [Penicillium malachiteum]
MRYKPLRASATLLPELDTFSMPSLKTSSPTSTIVMSPAMGKKILLLYRRENGNFVWKNKPGLRLTEDNPIINDIENETRVGELLSVISEHMATEKVLQN